MPKGIPKSGINKGCFKKGRKPSENELRKRSITLCKQCHLDFHNKYGRRNNTKEQIGEFIKDL